MIPPAPDATRSGRTLVLAHLDGQPVDHLPAMPITMMFAARLAGIPYREYCTDFRLLARGQVTVADRFGFDHVSAISDPAREAVDLGAPVTWFPDQPPALDDTQALLADPARLASLAVADPLGGGRVTDRVRGIELLRALAPGLFVEGWVEGPCAEGANLRGISTLMTDFGDDPGFVADLFDFTTRQAIEFARAQVDAGADMIGVGDAAASLVGPAIYRDVVLPHERRLADAIHAMGARVRLHICGNARRSVADMATVRADIVDLDSMVPLAQARADAGPDQVLLGNLNPVTEMLSSSPDAVAARVAACHREAGSGFIVGAGCEIPAATSHANVDAMVSYARATHPEAIPSWRTSRTSPRRWWRATGPRPPNSRRKLSEMLNSARAMKAGTELLEPVLLAAGVKPEHRAIVGTVVGDVHDIGKNLVAMMWKSGGLDVIDLGVNVPAKRFVEAAVEHDAAIIGVSALLTTTMPNMRGVIEAVRAANLPVKVVVGGAPVTLEFAEQIGADGYAPDAGAAVDLARGLLAG